jgi:2-keto-3-deoxy-L-rhamnonate aldolase RhmA
MTAIENTVRTRIASGGVALGFSLRQSRTVDIAMVAHTCDYDWLFIDTEHSSIDGDTAAQICVAALAVGIAPIVRIPSHEPYQAARALDTGALGVIFPHVDTPEQAKRCADACRFPPAGKRSMPGGLPQLNFASVSAPEAVRLANAATLVIVMLETPEAIANADAIAAVPGVDVLLIGSNDLCAEFGIHGQFGHEKIAQSYASMIAAARKHKKIPGMAGIFDETIMKKYIGMGAAFVQGGSDMSFINAGARARSAFVRSLGAPAG